MALATEVTTQSPVKVMVVLCPNCVAQAAGQPARLDQPARVAQPIRTLSYAPADEEATWEDAEWL